MEYSDYVSRTRQAANLSESGMHDEALDILHQLMESDISAIDKSIMCMNIATIWEKKKRPDQALVWYDRGIELERPFSRVFVALQKAGYLATRGYGAESHQLYLELLQCSFLTESEKETIRRNLKTIETGET